MVRRETSTGLQITVKNRDIKRLKPSKQSLKNPYHQFMKISEWFVIHYFLEMDFDYNYQNIIMLVG